MDKKRSPMSVYIQQKKVLEKFSFEPLCRKFEGFVEFIPYMFILEYSLHKMFPSDFVVLPACRDRVTSFVRGTPDNRPVESRVHPPTLEAVGSIQDR